MRSTTNPSELVGHKVNDCNESIKIVAMDEPGHGGACHHYNVTVDHGNGTCHGYELHFQTGAIKVTGPNGLTHEALLEIIIDRLQGFQSGDYKCRENAIAITHLEEALMWLQKRTRDRQARGVEGTHNR